MGTLGPGQISIMMMNSLEVVTFPKRGSRELFQTGETYQGQPLVDRQHPHDFFMNLSATYRVPLGSEAAALGADRSRGGARLRPDRLHASSFGG